MLTVPCLLPQTDIRRRLITQMFVVSALSTVGLLLGIIPGLNPGVLSLDSLIWSQAANAQPAASQISDQEVQSYAKSVLAIEPIRKTAYKKIQEITGSDQVPVVACHRPSSLSELPENIRDIAIDYCNQAIAIVESNGLTITSFNQITIAHQNNQDLAGRIRQAINRLQNNRG